MTEEEEKEDPPKIGGPRFCECDEPENETFDGGRTVRCVICGGE